MLEALAMGIEIASLPLYPTPGGGAMETTNRFVGMNLRNATRNPPRGWSRFLGVVALCLGLAGCGGGGGGGSADATAPAPTGLRVTVSDAYGVRIADAVVQATVGTAVATATTDTQGVALLVFSGVAGSVSATISRPTFLTQTVAAAVVANQVTDLAVTLVRATAAAGGSLTARPLKGATPPTVDPNDQTMTFEIELVVVGSDSQPITGLTAADFVLKPCTPDPSNDKVDCVRGAGAQFDAAYAPITAAAETSTLVPGDPAEPYAAALMLDQSASIAGSDPTGARLYSAKAFLDGLGVDDRVLLSAFASDPGALIPNPPLTVYPSFRDASTVSAAPSYYSTLDSLATLVGGGTPLYQSFDLLVDQVISDATLPPVIAKSVVIFTDGDDTECGDPDACRAVRQASITAANTKGVRVFTIGLSNGVNFEALGELANDTGGVFLFAENPEQLIPLYGSVGRLLSLSLPTYRLRWTVQAGSAGVFQTGNLLLGRVTVNAGASTFDVPIIVGIP